MRGYLFSAVLALGLVGAACASQSSPAVAGSGTNRLTSARVTFTSLADGKDADSAITVQLLRDSNELVADASSTGSKYDDDSTAPPLALAIKGGPFSERDASAGRLRLRLTPDGDDTWTFNVQLALGYEDATEQHYQWQAVRLDEKAPERTLVLEGARQ